MSSPSAGHRDPGGHSHNPCSRAPPSVGSVTAEQSRHSVGVEVPSSLLDKILEVLSSMTVSFISSLVISLLTSVCLIQPMVCACNAERCVLRRRMGVSIRCLILTFKLRVPSLRHQLLPRSDLVFACPATCYCILGTACEKTLLCSHNSAWYFVGYSSPCGAFSGTLQIRGAGEGLGI